jgi:hypothetical protein
VGSGGSPARHEQLSLVGDAQYDLASARRATLYAGERQAGVGAHPRCEIGVGDRYGRDENAAAFECGEGARLRRPTDEVYDGIHVEVGEIGVAPQDFLRAERSYVVEIVFARGRDRRFGARAIMAAPAVAYSAHAPGKRSLTTPYTRSPTLRCDIPSPERHHFAREIRAENQRQGLWQGALARENPTVPGADTGRRDMH